MKQFGLFPLILWKMETVCGFHSQGLASVNDRGERKTEKESIFQPGQGSFSPNIEKNAKIAVWLKCWDLTCNPKILEPQHCMCPWRQTLCVPPDTSQCLPISLVHSQVDASGGKQPAAHLCMEINPSLFSKAWRKEIEGKTWPGCTVTTSGLQRACYQRAANLLFLPLCASAHVL